MNRGPHPKLSKRIVAVLVVGGIALCAVFAAIGLGIKPYLMRQAPSDSNGNAVVAESDAAADQSQDTAVGGTASEGDASSADVSSESPLTLGDDGTPQSPSGADDNVSSDSSEAPDSPSDASDPTADNLDEGTSADTSSDGGDESYSEGPVEGEAAPEGLEPKGKTLQESMDEYFDQYFSTSGVPGMAVAVFDSKGIRYQSTLGVCTSEHQTFIIGSLSKSFTAVAIMQLVERGLVSLDAPASAYVPQYDTPDSVTIRSLLNQTSGFGYYDSLGDATVGLTAGRFSYANANYDLLGKVVEAVSGMDYGTYLKQNIFDPLGMTDASAGMSSERADEVPLYRNYFGLNVADGFVHQDSDDAWGTASSGYVRASLSDMEKYLQMYLNLGEGILEPDDVMKIFLSRVPDPGGDTYYGFGWTSFAWDDGEFVLSHDGQVENGVSRMCLLPDRDMGIVVLGDASDYFGGNANFFQMCDDVVSLSVGGEALGVDGSVLWRGHLQMDLLLGIVAFAAVFSLVRIRAWWRKLSSRKPSIVWWRLFFLHGLFPAVLLMIPWWNGVKWRDLATFVPDVTITLAASAALLIVGGVVKLCLLVRRRLAK